MAAQSFDFEQHMNLATRGMRPSATIWINELSNKLKADGRTVYKLGLGQSPFPVPGVMVRELQVRAHEKDYLPPRGLLALRKAIASYYKKNYGTQATADDILVGPGSKELMFQLQLVYYADLVLPSPSWVSYGPQARIIGRQVRWVQTRLEDGWRMTPKALAELCDEDPGRARLLILNYPSNPTGRSYSDSELKEIAHVARKHGVLVLADEIYGQTRHDGKTHASIAKYYPEGTIISNGISKWLGAGGWRLGCFVFPPNLRKLVDAMAAVASETFTSVSAPIQYAAIKGFEESSEIDEYLRDTRRVLRAIGAFSAETLSEAGIRCAAPEGGFYLFPDFTPLAGKLNARGVHTSAQLCEQLLQDTGVAILPGSDFGRPDNELTIRLAYVDFDGARALEAARAVPGSKKLDEKFVRTHCPNVVTAMEKMAAWARGSAKKASASKPNGKANGKSLSSSARSATLV